MFKAMVFIVVVSAFVCGLLSLVHPAATVIASTAAATAATVRGTRDDPRLRHMVGRLPTARGQLVDVGLDASTCRVRWYERSRAVAVGDHRGVGTDVERLRRGQVRGGGAVVVAHRAGLVVGGDGGPVRPVGVVA